jgi:hypothetical protein
MAAEQRLVLGGQIGEDRGELADLGRLRCLMDCFFSFRTSRLVRHVNWQRLGCGIPRTPQLTRQLSSDRLEPTDQLQRGSTAKRRVMFQGTQQHFLVEIIARDMPVAGLVSRPQHADHFARCDEML